MADENVLEIAVRANLAELKAEMESAATVTRQAMEQSAASVATLTQRVTLLEAELAAVPAAAKRTGAGMQEAAALTRHEMTEAKHTIALMGEEIGVRVPRHLRGFVAELPGVGQAMAAAFSGLAVLMLVQILVEAAKKVYEFYEALGKLTAEEKKAYADALKDSQDLFRAKGDELRAEYALAIARASGLDKDRLRVEEAKALRELGLQRTDDLLKQRDAIQGLIDKTKEEFAVQAQGASGSSLYPENAPEATPTPAYDKGTENRLKDLNEQLGIYNKAIHDGQVATTNATASEINSQSALTKATADEAQKRLASIEKLDDLMMKSRSELKKQLEEEEKAQTRRIDNQASYQLTTEEAALNKELEDIDKRLRAWHDYTLEQGVLLDSELQHERSLAEQRQQIIDNDVRRGLTTRADAAKAYQKSLDVMLAAEMATLQKKLALYEKDPSMSAKEMARVRAEVQKVVDEYNQQSLHATQKLSQQSGLTWRQYFQQIATQSKNAAETIRTNMQQALTAMTHGMGDAVAGWVVYGKSFSQAMLQVIGDVLSSFISMCVRLALEWLLAHIGIRATGATTAAAQITAAAGIAGANGIASWALAPWPIDAGAPAFGASMAAASMAYMPLAFFHGGGLAEYEMPAILKKDEMVLDSNLSKGMQDIIRNGKTGGNGLTLHVSMPVQAIDSRSFQGMVEKHASTLAKSVKKKLKGVKLG